MSDENMGERIHKLRTNRGWTQEVLANKAAVTRVTISHLETSHVRHSSAAVVMRVAAALGTTIDYLVTGASKPEREKDDEVIRRYRLLSTHDKDRVGRLVANLRRGVGR